MVTKSALIIGSHDYTVDVSNVGEGSCAFKSGLIGGATGASTGGIAGKIGDVFHHEPGSFGNEFGRALAHGAAGGAVEEIQGGEFRHGFYAGFFGSAAGSLAPSLGFADYTQHEFSDVAKRTAFAAVVGGTASALGGGKFANGAITATFQHLFNAEYAATMARSMGAPASSNAAMASQAQDRQDAAIKDAADKGIQRVVQPDFVVINVGVGYRKGFYQLSLAEDRHGEWYWSWKGGGFGESIGKWRWPFSASWQAGWIAGTIPSREATYNFLTDDGLSLGGGDIFGATLIHSPGANQYAVSFGLTTPQIGTGYSWTDAIRLGKK